MRVVKEHDEQKNEIIDTAERLFFQKGYDKCSVNDILTMLGISKGAFNYYFKSKEEVFDAIIQRTAQTGKCITTSKIYGLHSGLNYSPPCTYC